ncbi:MAG: ImmA/IrrE family metallo-endopeptidase [Gammaproteobacteria bacterium]|nr:ImmA/IrrE family metallo-endopeptidase [Gammaproteobacteria bacterium]
MIDLVSGEVLEDLRNEDPVTAVELHFSPVRVRCLPPAQVAGQDCSVDGYYETNVDPDRPLILYSDDAVAERVRFTIIHELGHHILSTSGAELLDDLDQLGGSAQGACAVEELVCHQFAGGVLVPSQLLQEVIGDESVTPQHVLHLREQTNASWEALAVQVANYPDHNTAVVLVRDLGVVSFVAANGLVGWPRSCAVKPGGVLDRALRLDATTPRSDVYRYGLTRSESLFCVTKRVHAGLAVAVMSSRRGDGGLSMLDRAEPAWKEKEEFCGWCNSERDVGWCDACSGRKCRSCERCGCGQPIQNPICSGCHMSNPRRAGAELCVDCEADLPS